MKAKIPTPSLSPPGGGGCPIGRARGLFYINCSPAAGCKTGAASYKSGQQLSQTGQKSARRGKTGNGRGGGSCCQGRYFGPGQSLSRSAQLLPKAEREVFEAGQRLLKPARRLSTVGAVVVKTGATAEKSGQLSRRNAGSGGRQAGLGDKNCGRVDAINETSDCRPVLHELLIAFFKNCIRASIFICIILAAIIFSVFRAFLAVERSPRFITYARARHHGNFQLFCGLTEYAADLT